MASYLSRDIGCPFYKYDTRQVIRCEGLIDNQNISLTFGRNEDKLKWAHDYCMNAYRYCEIYITLMRLKYDEDIH